MTTEHLGSGNPPAVAGRGAAVPGRPPAVSGVPLTPPGHPSAVAGDPRSVPMRLPVLVAGMARREERALGEFYDQTNAQVYGLVLRIVGEREAAEEVTVDVYHQVWRQAGRYDEGRGTPLGWVLKIARSRALDRLRTESAGRRHTTTWNEAAMGQLPDPAPTPEAAALSLDLGAIIRGALGNLPREQAEVLELAFYGGLSHSQIAEHLRHPLGTVKTRIRLGMQHLARSLAPQENLG